VPGRFERTVRQVSEVGNVVVDAASFAPAGLSSAETTRLPMSNALLVGARRSTTGKPLFVAGPQVGHFYPGILLELDLEGGGFKSRGAAFPGISFGVLLGRGIDYAWSATSAGSDLVDEYVETLCGGDTGYLHRGECRQMTMFEAGTIVGRPGQPDRQLTYRETVHGPVKGYATVGGQRVAITSRRSTRGRELASLRFFLDLSMNRIRSARDFVRAASGMVLPTCSPIRPAPSWIRSPVSATSDRFPGSMQVCMDCASSLPSPSPPNWAAPLSKSSREGVEEQ
jgi:acyl-homoserine lactone acylase PvdQ